MGHFLVKSMCDLKMNEVVLGDRKKINLKKKFRQDVPIVF